MNALPARASWWLAALSRVLFVVAILGLWFWTQGIIGGRTAAAQTGAIGDGIHDLLAVANRYLHAHPVAADGLLIISSAVIDLLGAFLLGAAVLGPSVRPVLGLVLLFAMRQICQLLCALPPPAGMIWRDPGWPTFLVTYDVATDFFFSGHTGLAVLGAIELVRVGGRRWLFPGTLIIVFEAGTVLVLRAHYTMDVFTATVAARYASILAQRWAPWFDGALARLRGASVGPVPVVLPLAWLLLVSTISCRRNLPHPAGGPFPSYTGEGHVGAVTSLAFNPDGKWLASASRDHSIKLWDVESGREIRAFIGHTNGVTCVAFSPNGRYLASAAGDNTIRLWDPATGRHVRSFEDAIEGFPNRRWAHSYGIHVIAFSPDGNRLASGAGDQTVKLWDVDSGRKLLTFVGHVRGEFNNRAGVLSASFSGDGRQIASAAVQVERVEAELTSRTRVAGSEIKLWDAATGREIRTFDAGKHVVFRVAFNPNGTTLASAGLDKTIKLWDTVSGREISTLRGHFDPVYSVAFSPDGNHLVSGGLDFTVRVWNVDAGREARTLRGHTRGVFSVAVSPDGRRLASGSYDQTVMLWDSASGELKRTLNDTRRESLDSPAALVKVWDAYTGQEVLTVRGIRDGIKHLVVTPGGTRLATFPGAHAGVSLWDVATAHEVGRLGGVDTFDADTVSTTEGEAFAFSPDGRWFAMAVTSMGSDGKHTTLIQLEDVSSGRHTQPLRGHTASIHSLAFSPDGRRLISGSADQTIKLWDLASGAEVRTMGGHAAPVLVVAVSPDGRRLASGCHDRTIKFWDAATGKEQQTLKGHAHAVHHLAFSPDGQRLASASWDKTIRLWEVDSGREARAIKVTDWVSGIAFSPDPPPADRLAASIMGVGIKIWDVHAGEEVLTIQLPQPAAVRGNPSFSPDGKRIACGVHDPREAVNRRFRERRVPHR